MTSETAEPPGADGRGANADMDTDMSGAAVSAVSAVGARDGVQTSAVDTAADGAGGAADSTRASANGERGRKSRVVFFCFMALLMQLAFVVSYVGGMHSPQAPHRMPVAAVGPAQVAAQLQQALDAKAPNAFDIVAKPDAAAATAALKNRDVYGVYAPSQDGHDTLQLASAAGPPAAQVLKAVFTQVSAAQQHQLTTTDAVPVRSTDIEGLVPFYLVIAWSVGGYLCSTLVGLMGGMQSRTPRLAAERLALYAGYSILGGLGGTFIAHTVLGFIGGNWLTLAFLGTMVVFSVSVFANGLQSGLGLIGTGVVIGLFVILGNPSGAGPWPREMMPAFWRTIGPWLPNYQGTQAARGISYFASNGLTPALWVMAAYAVIGIALSIGLAGRDNPVLRFSAH